MSSFNEDNMVYEIKKLLVFVKNPKYSDETGDYMSDGEMLDHVVSKLEYLSNPKT
jgi:hypothetical protein|tara:strand:- start:432 stop:596 length:165 start_codon:yes stop_codon:yes gene_type:complete